MNKLALAVSAVLSTVSTSAQITVWVDPALGSDSATGLSASDPFRTITHAASGAVGADEIRLGPGVYAGATGEVFPFDLAPETRIVATGTQGETVVVARPNQRVTFLREGCQIEGVAFRGAHNSELFSSSTNTPVPTFTNCLFEDSRHALNYGSAAFQGCTFRNFSGAVYDGSHGSFGATKRVTFESCEITECSGSAVISASAFYYDGFYLDVELNRCRIIDNAGVAVRVSFDWPSAANVRVHDSLVVDNGSGISVGWHATSATVEVVGSTISGNGSYGIESDDCEVVIRSSIIAGHSVSDVPDDAQVSTSLIGDGSGELGYGTMSGDPGFVDPASDDWSLRFDSPCLDRGEPGRYAADLNGITRAVDSDLDLVPAPDMGALEHLTLRGPKSITVGETATLGLTGPSNGFSTIVMSPGGFAQAGLSTPFGRYFLRPDTAFRLTPVPTSGGAPTWMDVGPMIDSAWVGTSIGVQALPRSFASPSGGAFTNPILIQLN